MFHLKSRVAKIELLIFLFFLLFYISVTGGNFWESDSQAAYYTTQAMIDRGNFAIPCYWATKAANGNCYSQYGVMISAAIVPFYLVEKVFRDVFHSSYFFPGFWSSLTNPFLTSLLVLLIFKFLKRLVSLKNALITTFIFGLATYLPAYTKTLYSEPLITLLVFSAIYLLLFFPPTKKILFWSGLLFGLAFLTKLASLIFGVGFLYLFWNKKIPLKKIIYFCLPIFCCIAIFFGYNYVRFGNILDTGYRNIKFDHPLFYGLYLHLLSPGKSFFLYQPIILLAFFAFKNFFKQQKTIFISIGLMATVNLLFYSVYMHPMGDLTWGSRYIYPNLVLFIIGLAFFLEKKPNKLLKKLFVITLVVSLVIQFSTVYISYHRYFSFLSTKYIERSGNYRGNYTEIAYDQPLYSPLLGQWRLIFGLGNRLTDQAALRQAFQEYIIYNPNYRLAPSDILFIRSRKDLPIFMLLTISELFLAYRLYRLFNQTRPSKNLSNKQRAKAFGQNNESIVDDLIRELRFRRIKQAIPKNSTLADLGSGYNGELLKSLSRKIESGVGFDLSVQKMVSTKNISLKMTDLSHKLPLKDHSFDVVTTIAVVEHVEKPALLLSESFRILKPKGLLILTTPSSKAKPLLEFLAFKLHIISSSEISDHKRYYNPTSLKKALQQAGFKEKNIQISTFQLGMNIFAKCIKQ